MAHTLEELIDVKEFQHILERFSDATGVVTALLELDGKVLIATGWQEICTKFHRRHPICSQRCRESDTALAARLEKGEKYNVYKCMNGLYDVAVPVIIEGRHMGNFFTGQFFFEPPDMDFFRRQAGQHGFDEEDYIESLKKVPVFTEEYIQNIMSFLVGLTVVIAKTALTHMQQAELAAENAMILQEMEVARKIQISLLPINFENISQDFEIAASMLTADDVGGDFYDINIDKSGHLWIAVGDVSGHGVTPGLIMMMAQTAHVTIADNLDCDARELVIKINRLLYKNVHERLKEKHFMTFNVLKYLGDGRFEHAGAHLRIIVFRRESNQCELIRTRGFYLNLRRDISKASKNSYFELKKGDVMILYTDGLTEAENPDGEILDISRFVKIIEKYAHQSPEVIKENIMNQVLTWCENARLDDMSLVIVKRKER